MPPILLRFLPHLIVAGVFVAAVGWYGQTRYAAGEARAEARYARDAEVARVAARAKEQNDRQAAKEVEDALQKKLADSVANAAGLARRLRDYQARANLSRPASPAALPDGASGVPEGGGDPGTRVDAALEAALAACWRDAERLNGWQQWWERVKE